VPAVLGLGESNGVAVAIPLGDFAQDFLLEEKLLLDFAAIFTGVYMCDFIGTRDNQPNSRSSPEGVLDILAKLGVSRASPAAH